MKTLCYGIIICLSVLVVLLYGIEIYPVFRLYKKEQIIESVCKEPLLTDSYSFLCMEVYNSNNLLCGSHSLFYDDVP